MSETNEFARLVNGDGETVVSMIGPGRSDDALSVALRILTQQLHAKGLAEKSGGCFGGEFGYGASFENDTFLMHPYCWCENGATCPWCYGCTCGSNSMVDHRTTEPGLTCDWCSGVHKYADRGALPPNDEPHYGAPHFWHKPTGVRVWWYKYIGRDMRVHVEQDVPLQDIIASTLASLGTTIEVAATEYEQAEERAAEAADRQIAFMNSEQGRKFMDDILGEATVVHIEEWLLQGRVTES